MGKRESEQEIASDKDKSLMWGLQKGRVQKSFYIQFRNKNWLNLFLDLFSVFCTLREKDGESTENNSLVWISRKDSNENYRESNEQSILI